MADRRPWRGPPLWGDILDRTEPREVYLRVFPPGKDGMPMELGITGLPFWEKRTIGSPPLRPEHPLSLAQLKKRAAWWLYCATTEDLQPKGWRPEKEPPARVQSPLDWYCVRCGKKLTRGWWLCAACEAELNCKGGDLTEDNPRCQRGGDLYVLFELKRLVRHERDTAKLDMKREASLDPDVLPVYTPDGALASENLAGAEHGDTWRDTMAGHGTVSPDSLYFSEVPDELASSEDDGIANIFEANPFAVATTARLSEGYQGRFGYMAVERSWHPPRGRRYDAWYYTRPEWALEHMLWAPYQEDSLNRAYRRACYGLSKPKRPTRAVLVEDGEDERREAWHTEFEQLLSSVALSPLEHQVVTLARDGTKQVRIAEIVGLSQPRVSETLSRARAKLRANARPPQLNAARPRPVKGKRVIRPKKAPAPPSGQVGRDRAYDTSVLKKEAPDKRLFPPKRAPQDGHYNRILADRAKRREQALARYGVRAKEAKTPP
jgi:DNA-binding CsgD family transcriptional regulator